MGHLEFYWNAFYMRRTRFRCLSVNYVGCWRYPRIRLNLDLRFREGRPRAAGARVVMLSKRVCRTVISCWQMSWGRWGLRCDTVLINYKKNILFWCLSTSVCPPWTCIHFVQSLTLIHIKHSQYDFNSSRHNRHTTGFTHGQLKKPHGESSSGAHVR